jgi:hypothetical protein
MIKLFKLKTGLVIIGLTTLIHCSSNTYINEDSSIKTVSMIGEGDVIPESGFLSDKSFPINNGEDLLKNMKNIVPNVDVTFSNDRSPCRNYNIYNKFIYFCTVFILTNKVKII